MKKNTAVKYIICPKSKGQLKKHVAVCQKCKTRKDCHTFQDYVLTYIKI